jgi:hypothetical protein
METPLFAAVTAGNLAEVQQLLKKETKETIDAVSLNLYSSSQFVFFFKLIRFQGYSQTLFLVSSAVYLAFIRIDLSTITREDNLGGGGC